MTRERGRQSVQGVAALGKVHLLDWEAEEVIAALSVERVQSGYTGLGASVHETEVLGKVGDVLRTVGNALLECCHTPAAVTTSITAD